MQLKPHTGSSAYCIEMTVFPSDHNLSRRFEVLTAASRRSQQPISGARRFSCVLLRIKNGRSYCAGVFVVPQLGNVEIRKRPRQPVDGSRQMYTTASAAEADFTDIHIYRRTAKRRLTVVLRALLVIYVCVLLSYTGTGLVSRRNTTPNCYCRSRRVRQGHLRHRCRRCGVPSHTRLNSRCCSCCCHDKDNNSRK